MKGIILAGGTGSRLYPLTKITNKHLLPVYNKPMIYYPLQTLIDSDISDIRIVSGKGHAGDFLELLGSGTEFGVHLSYEVQEESGGIAQALGLCEEWADKENIVVILGDNIFEDNIKEQVQSFKSGAAIFLKWVKNANRFGVPNFNTDGSIYNIEEKPLFKPEGFAVTGLYIYDKNAFSYIHDLKPSKRNELEITDVNNKYIKEKKLTYHTLKGFWSDAGTFSSLLDASILVGKNDSE